MRHGGGRAQEDRCATLGACQETHTLVSGARDVNPAVGRITGGAAERKLFA